MALRKEVEAFIADNLSPDGRRDLFIAIAGEQIAAFEDGWRGALATPPDFEHFVDGRPSGNPFEVKMPGGFVSERVVAATPVVMRAVALLDQMTKVVTGDYKSRTRIFRNDVAIASAGGIAFSDDDLIVIGNLSPFARKAEQEGFNKASGAGDGLFETVAAILGREFQSSPVPIYFTYRALGDDVDDRVPVIAIGEGATDAGRRGRTGRRATAKSFAQAYARQKGRA